MCKYFNLRSYRKYTTDIRFFNSFVPDPNSGCWLWIGSMHMHGYGQINHEGKSVRAHRYSWVLHNGEIPNGMFICHKCDNRLCVNPNHLFLGTRLDNTKDMLIKKRQLHGSKHHKSKLTENDIKNILLDSRHVDDIASSYCVCKQNIYLIKSRKIWKHVNI